MGYGKKNHVKLDPLSYNIYIGGESKIGKTTTNKTDGDINKPINNTAKRNKNEKSINKYRKGE